MYVCLCHAVTDRAIEEAAARGVRTFKELSFSTGCGTQCGTCARSAREILQLACSRQTQTPQEAMTQGLNAA